MINQSSYRDLNALKGFKPISLAEMDEVRLMNRNDTKFVFKRSDLAVFLKKLSPSYRALTIEGVSASTYNTLYFDTQNFQFYLDHHNGKGNRYKVRIRNYQESDLFFLEIKNKYKGRTLKNRISLSDFQLELSEKSNAYIEAAIGEAIPLEAKLWNKFRRITLVSNSDNERLTLDLDLNFKWENKVINYSDIVVAELKQEYANRNSVFYNLMKENLIREHGMSKYCIGALGIYPSLKYNNFKDKIRTIEKLIE